MVELRIVADAVGDRLRGIDLHEPLRAGIHEIQPGRRVAVADAAREALRRLLHVGGHRPRPAVHRLQPEARLAVLARRERRLDVETRPALQGRHRLPRRGDVVGRGERALQIPVGERPVRLALPGIVLLEIVLALRRQRLVDLRRLRDKDAHRVDELPVLRLRILELSARTAAGDDPEVLVLVHHLRDERRPGDHAELAVALRVTPPRDLARLRIVARTERDRLRAVEPRKAHVVEVREMERILLAHRVDRARKTHAELRLVDVQLHKPRTVPRAGELRGRHHPERARMRRMEVGERHRELDVEAVLRLEERQKPLLAVMRRSGHHHAVARHLEEAPAIRVERGIGLLAEPLTVVPLGRRLVRIIELDVIEGDVLFVDDALRVAEAVRPLRNAVRPLRRRLAIVALETRVRRQDRIRAHRPRLFPFEMRRNRREDDLEPRLLSGLHELDGRPLEPELHPRAEPGELVEPVGVLTGVIFRDHAAHGSVRGDRPQGLENADVARERHDVGEVGTNRLHRAKELAHIGHAVVGDVLIALIVPLDRLEVAEDLHIRLVGEERDIDRRIRQRSNGERR